MLKEIGSNFWINPDEVYEPALEVDLRKYGIYGNDFILLSTGRSAEKMVLETIEERNPSMKKTALIPPYTCETVINPFVQLGYEIYTYHINEALFTTPDMLKNDIEELQPKVILFHRYFGFDTFYECASVIQEARERGIILIEDKTQNLYSRHMNLDVDYIIGSFRKWSGLPDGGFAVCRDGIFHNKPEKYNSRLQETKLDASYAKYRYMILNQGEKDSFLDKYREAESVLANQTGHYSICPASKSIQASLDVENLKRKRQENYKFLFRELKDCNGIKTLTPPVLDEDIPLYYVLLAENRDSMQAELRNENIYAPIVWPSASTGIGICKEAEYIYQHVLCLPIDQRYDLEDMMRMANCVKKVGDKNDEHKKICASGLR